MSSTFTSYHAIKFKKPFDLKKLDINLIKFIRLCQFFRPTLQKIISNIEYDLSTISFRHFHSFKGSRKELKISIQVMFKNLNPFFSTNFPLFPIFCTLYSFHKTLSHSKSSYSEWIFLSFP